jgi:hypothetical protein
MIPRHKPILILGIGLLGALPALAQDAPFLRRNNVEVGVFPGASYGVDKSRFLVGSNVAWAATKHVMPYGEFTYFPELERNFRRTDSGLTQDVNYKFRLYDIHGGVHLRIPIKESRIVPYAAIGAGYLRSRLTVNNIAPRSANDLAVNGGGGLRFYVGERWGFRFEAKVYRTTNGDLEGTFGKVVGGIFYQIR